MQKHEFRVLISNPYPEVNIMKNLKKVQKKKIVAISNDGSYTVTGYFDKNNQFCDIQPRFEGVFIEGRFQSITQDTLNTFRGQPYDICHDEVLSNLKYIANNEQVTEEEPENFYEESGEQSTEEE